MSVRIHNNPPKVHAQSGRNVRSINTSMVAALNDKNKTAELIAEHWRRSNRIKKFQRSAPTHQDVVSYPWPVPHRFQNRISSQAASRQRKKKEMISARKLQHIVRFLLLCKSEKTKLLCLIRKKKRKKIHLTLQIIVRRREVFPLRLICRSPRKNNPMNQKIRRRMLVAQRPKKWRLRFYNS